MATDPRLAQARTYAGHRSSRVNPRTNTCIVVLDGDAAGLDTDGGRWQTLCDDHNCVIAHETLAQARAHAAHPDQWCDVDGGCMDSAR